MALIAQVDSEHFKCAICNGGIFRTSDGNWAHKSYQDYVRAPHDIEPVVPREPPAADVNGAWWAARQHRDWYRRPDRGANPRSMERG